MSTKTYAYYRLPYSNTYTKVESESAPNIISELKDIGNAYGFVFVPFYCDGQHPAILITPERVETHECLHHPVSETDNDTIQTSSSLEPSADYTTDFTAFHTNILNGTFRKLVLARSLTLPAVEESPEQLFHKACALYPRAMIMLVSSELTGIWLIATPEVLIESENDRYRTMALAGTMPHSEGLPVWSQKNQEEQHIVEQYIDDAIAPYATNIIKDGPHTVRAANLIHLCTTFRFHLQSSATIGDVVASLHPTPAVCGLPQAAAQRFICDHEHCDRSYYSGFAGPVGINNSTHLYVSLRCMQIADDDCTLYAGGGIMPYSQLGDEWMETERKLKTMKQCIQTKQI